MYRSWIHVAVAMLAASCGSGAGSELDAFHPRDGSPDAFASDASLPVDAMPFLLRCNDATVDQPAIIPLSFAISNMVQDRDYLFLLRDSPSGTPDALLRLSKATGEITVLAPGVAQTGAIALDDDYVYLATNNFTEGVIRVAKSGGPIEVLFTTGRARDVAVTNDYVYAFAGHPADLWRIPKSGGPAESLLRAIASTQLRSHGNKIYYVDHDHPQHHRIVELDADTAPAGMATPLLRAMAIFQDVHQLAITSTGPVWSTPGGIKYAPFEMTPEQSLFPNVGHISFFAQGDSVRWFHSNGGTTRIYDYDPQTGVLAQSQEFTGIVTRAVEDATHY